MIKESVISSKKGFRLLEIIKETFNQFFLIGLFVKRDYNTYFKQTILGPIWFFIQPVFTMVVYVVIFEMIAGIDSGNIPGPLFYLSGILCWNYFSENTIKISTTFLDNSHIFGKVYFPRIVMPIANMITSYIKLALQFVLLIAVTLYYGLEYFNFNLSLLILPVCIIGVSLFSTALGLIVSSLTTKYRDLKFLIQFGIQLLMYGSAVVWPLPLLEKMTQGENRWLYESSLFNPLIHFIEGFRYALYGEGYFNINWYLYSCGISILFLMIGMLLFSRTEKDFMDTI